MRIPNQSADQIFDQMSGFYPTKWIISNRVSLSKKACNCSCASCQGQKSTIVKQIG